ncbi:MAG TPA: efflux RND transporter periplasmic adaptor subunit [Vulgatibacter sp.]|nr:efflux RND transporter periplasmic adaptor subunit [Vulgatibacter sp.]
MSENIENETGERAPPGTRIASMVRWGMLAAALLGAGWAVATFVADSGGHAHAEGRYHCPMHPTVVSDRPGSCPICGMDLVPIEEGADHAHVEVAEDDASIRAAAEKLGAAPGQWICPMPEDGVVRDEPGRCETCGMSLVQVPGKRHQAEGPALYECPMHPEVVHEGPGKCPKCGMYLVRKENPAGDSHAHHHPPAEGEPAAPVEKRGVPGLGPVTIHADRLARIGVRTAVAERGRLESQVRTVGVVTPDERKRYVVQARFSGWIEELLVDETGARVKAGQPLARIYSPELHQAQVDYLQSRGVGPEMRQAAEQRLRLLGIAQSDIDALRKAGRAQRTMVLRAPGAGHVLRKDAVAGSYVSPGAALFEVADLSNVWVVADVFEQEIARVRVGANATFGAPSLPGDRFVGKVSFVYPTVEPSTRTMKVRLEIDNPEIALRPGMFGDVRLDVDAPPGIIVPRDAVIDGGEHVYALVSEGGGRFSPREVHVTGRAGDHVMVVGLDEGEEVVVSAGFFIDSESRLRAALGGLGDGQSAAAHAHDHGGAP